MPLTANAAQYQAVQWGYVMYCALNTLDWPCSSSVIGTAIISSGAPSVATSGCAYVNCGLPYYTMLGFIGVRTYTNRYGQKTVSNVSLSQVGEDYGDQLLYLQQPFTDGDGITYRLNGTDGALTQVPGGLLGNEANVYLDPWPVETIAIAPGGPSNALNFDPSLTVFCSTAPGFVSSAYNASSYGAAGSSSMSACIGSFPTVSRPSAATTATGLRTFSLQYAIGDGASYLASVSGTLYTDGSVGTDALGNTYYNLIAITGTRTYTSLLTNTTTVTNITSLMAQNIVPTSNRPDITNTTASTLSTPTSTATASPTPSVPTSPLTAPPRRSPPSSACWCTGGHARGVLQAAVGELPRHQPRQRPAAAQRHADRQPCQLRAGAVVLRHVRAERDARLSLVVRGERHGADQRCVSAVD